MTTTEHKSIHIPVLLHEVIDALDLHPGDTVFDGTLGGGGYTKAIADRVGVKGRVFATDKDTDAIGRFDTGDYPTVEIVHSGFARVADICGRAALDGAVLDLGISSDQLADRERGISFQDLEAPLDMRMNQSVDNHLTAWGILNTWEQDEIADMLYHYAEERRSRPIARSIVAQRELGQMETVGDLVRAIEQVVSRRGKVHPATKTFQALRIAVNDELGELERFLKAVPQCMKTGGRLAIVSFHSLEDRLVKQTFRDWEQQGVGTRAHKKPIAPTDSEIAQNPRSRSSKLRTFIFN